MKVFVFKKFWNISHTKKYDKYIFIFGDNDMRVGMGGQAVIREQKNAMGIPTKKEPNNDDDSFYNDLEYSENISKIKYAINKIKNKLKTGKYDGIIIPKNGLGTGLSELPKRAPKTYKKLKELMEKFEIFVLSL